MTREATLWEARLPRRNSWRPERWRRPKVPAVNSSSPWNLPVSKEYWPDDLLITLFTSSLWDSPWSRVIWYVLPGACNFDSAGSYRGIFGLVLGRCQPMHHSCKTCYHYAQGYTISPVYLCTTPSLLNILLPKVCFSLSVGCRLCGILHVWGEGIKHGINFVYICHQVLWGLFLLWASKKCFYT